MRAILALEDGLTFVGRSFTGPGETHGEVIFNTCMTGYQEILTDPSHAGQMVVMTYPLVGNYGINAEDFESSHVQVEGFIVKECCKTPSNWRSRISLPDFLTRNQVIGIEGIDTRALTRHLRLHGVKRGVISTLESDPAKLVARAKTIPGMEGKNLTTATCPAAPYTWTDAGVSPVTLTNGTYAWSDSGPRVLIFDFGVKWRFLRTLSALGLDLLMVPPPISAATVDALKPDAIFLSSGPGDPAALTDVLGTLKALLERYPIAGIGLGHQLLGLALGGRTYKLKYGHHGCNHPIKDLASGRVDISSQNHNFCVDINQLDGVETTHINLNDGTLEGFAHRSKPIIGIQYQPEANSDPRDGRNFFTRFRQLVRDAVGK